MYVLKPKLLNTEGALISTQQNLSNSVRLTELLKKELQNEVKNKELFKEQLQLEKEYHATTNIFLEDSRLLNSFYSSDSAMGTTAVVNVGGRAVHQGNITQTVHHEAIFLEETFHDIEHRS